MPTNRDPRKVIEALLAKAADPATTLEESVALTEKAQELRKKYHIPTSDYPSGKEPPKVDTPFPTMTDAEFINLFHTTPRGQYTYTSPTGLHVSIFPTRGGKSYYITWLSEQMAQENPQANEETWDLIDPDSPEY